MKQTSRSSSEGKPESPSPTGREKILVIFNPRARSEKAKGLRDKIQALDPDAVVRPTGGPGDAADIARQAVDEGFTTVVAGGGDGTVNEVVNGLAGSKARLGLLPLGTMNIFASELGIPSNRLRQCWDIIRAGHCRPVDLALANRHYFVQLAGVGFDAQAVAGVDWQAKKNFGPLSYVFSAAKVVAARKPPVLRIQAEGQPERSGSFVLVGNGRYYGAPLAVFKQAVIDDGKLDVIVVKNLGYLDFIRYIQCIIMGTHLSLKDVDSFQTSHLSVEVVKGEDVPFEADGELVGFAPVTFQITGEQIQVLAPPVK